MRSKAIRTTYHPFFGKMYREFSHGYLYSDQRNDFIRRDVMPHATIYFNLKDGHVREWGVSKIIEL